MKTKEAVKRLQKQTGERKMKKFFAEFKKFITRGNVVDMAVGVIVGSSFTAIVNALSNNILKPIINWLLASSSAPTRSVRCTPSSSALI